jgi:hypothetical protein
VCYTKDHNGSRVNFSDDHLTSPFDWHTPTATSIQLRVKQFSIHASNVKLSILAIVSYELDCIEMHRFLVMIRFQF